MPAFKFAGEIETGSVLREARPAEAVIDARSNHINVLTDPVSPEYCARSDSPNPQNTSRYEADVAVTHEKVIVLDRNRPIRCESEFEARSDDTTPACFTRRIEQRACCPCRKPNRAVS